VKYVVPALTFLLVVPRATQAQIDLSQLDLRLPSLEDPALRANIGPWSVAATLGSRGLDLRVDDRATVERGTASRRPSRVPEPTGRGTSRAPTTTSRGGSRSSASASASAVLNTAEDYLGVPYVWGGTTPRGFDCSGFVQYVFRRHGVELPRTSRQQAVVGLAVGATVSALRAGDLMFFATNGRRIDHVAIYAGNNEIIHSSSSGGGVGYDNLSSSRGEWFTNHHVATRRVLANGLNLVGDLSAALRSFTRLDLDPPDRAPRRR
jgi:cell wall-associated NlpC family hydrolase